MLKIIRTIWGIIRTLLTIVIVALIAVIVTQRVSDNKKAVAGFRIFTVITESMVPEYVVGDAIFTKTIDPAEIQVGDDITYLGTAESFKDKIVTHRVINKEKGEDGLYIFETKGIANPEPDPKINETQIYGKVIYKIKSISYINSVIGNLYGMYFAIFVPLGIIMFIEYVGFRRDRDEAIEEIEEEDKKRKRSKYEKEENKDKEELKEYDDNEKEEKDQENDLKEKMKKRRNHRREKRRNRK